MDLRTGKHPPTHRVYHEVKCRENHLMSVNCFGIPNLVTVQVDTRRTAGAEMGRGKGVHLQHSQFNQQSVLHRSTLCRELLCSDMLDRKGRGQGVHLQHDVLSEHFFDHALLELHPGLDELARSVLPQSHIEAAQHLSRLYQYHPALPSHATSDRLPY